ncbi:MAG: hypothetical protein ACT4PV_05895 [Planctomycetaceae bacterium]
MEWYGVRCLFGHGPSEIEAGACVYEERIVILRAASFEDAVAKAEQDAATYASAFRGVEYLGLSQAYEIADELADDPRQECAEIFSLMRSSTLGASDYIRRFFATGAEHQGSIDGPA